MVYHHVMRHLVLLLTFHVLVSCTPAADPKPLDECAQMCEHGSSTLGGCEFSLPSDDGAPCETICRNSRKNGRVWDAECILEAIHCDVADDC